MSELFRFSTTEDDRPRCVVIGVQLPGVTEAELGSSLEELERLARTLGLDPVLRVTQRRSRLAPGKVLGDGKLKEVANLTGGTGEIPSYSKPGKRKRDDGEDTEEVEETAADVEEPAETTEEPEDGAAVTATPAGEGEGDGEAPAAKPEPIPVVLVDHDLTPTQQRNLERALDAEVLDRSSIILGIFHRHARTREARLQVEIARLHYLAPRLRESGGGGDRVRGGVGGKGAGESSLELDRRRIRDRISELRHELAAIEGGSKTRRGRRGDVPTVALVGYTNAGKSSLMRALTGTEVLVADKLFATLDTTVRVLTPRTKPPILVSDTVGFIKKLPHDLVASFRSTLEEAAEANLLLHVVDASDAAFRDQLQVTRDVLAEIDADKSPTLVLLNKIDKVDAEGRAALAAEFPDAIELSAKDPADIAALHDRIVANFEGDLENAELMVPWAQHRLVHEIHERCRVLAEEHEAEGTRITIRGAARAVAELRAALAAAPDAQV